MALDSYANLKTAIDNWTRRSLSSYVDDFIDVVEAELRRHPAVKEDTYDTFTVDAEVKNLPSNCNIVKSLYFDENNAHYEIELKTPKFLAEQKASQFGNSAARPRFAAIVEHGTKIKFSPVPDQAYTPIIHYETKLDSLSSTQTTNWLLTNHPDVYLWGALMASAAFLKDDERIPTWARNYARALEQLEQFEKRRNAGLGSLTWKPRRPIG